MFRVKVGCLGSRFVCDMRLGAQVKFPQPHIGGFLRVKIHVHDVPTVRRHIKGAKNMVVVSWFLFTC